MRYVLPLLALLSPALAPAETIYVSNEKGNSITVIDGATLAVTATWPVGRRARGIQISRDGKYLYLCASEDNAVQVIDAATGRVIADLPSGEDPEQIALCSPPTNATTS